MSVESLAIAINHSRASGTARLVLIGIANHDGDGGAWPTLDTLARYAAVDRSNVRKALQKLEALGEIRRDVQAGGTALIADHQRPNLYHFLLRCPPDCDHSRNHRTRHSSAPAELSTRGALPPPVSTEGGGGTAPRGEAVAPPKPSLNPSPLQYLEAGTDRTCAHETYRLTNVGEFCVACGVRRDGRKRISWSDLTVHAARRRA